MRPDKKKVRHHDSRRKEAQAKQKLSKGDSKKPPSSFSSSSKLDRKGEDASLGDKKEGLDHRFAKRSVVSNWTRYEISSDEDSESEFMTGEDFSTVLQNASKADSLFQLKAEKEWNQEQDVFKNEYFTLDLNQLAKDINQIPLHLQISLTDDDINSETKKYLDSLCEYSSAAQIVNADEVNKNIIDKLSEDFKSKSIELKEKKSEVSTESKTKTEEVEELEEWLDDFLGDD